MTDGLRVGFVGGIGLPGNVYTFLENLRRALRAQSTTVNYDLVVTDNVDSPDGFTKIDPGIPRAGTAREELTGLSKALQAYAREHSPDVLFQVTRLPTHGTATTVAGRLTRTPTVTRLAGDNFSEHRFADNTAEKLRTFALKNCIGLVPVQFSDAIIVLGPHGRRQVEKRFRRRRVYTIPQPVDTGRFNLVSRNERLRIRSSLGMPNHDETRVLLTVGRVNRRKGIHDLMKAAHRLAQDGDSVKWYVVGDGYLQDFLEPSSVIEAVGRVPHDQIADYYRAADLYVHPSLHEGLPNSLLESAACGTPAIARDVGDCSEVAVATFTDVRELEALICQRYDRVELDDQFTPDRLGKRYHKLLREVTT